MRYIIVVLLSVVLITLHGTPVKNLGVKQAHAEIVGQRVSTLTTKSAPQVVKPSVPIAAPQPEVLTVAPPPVVQPVTYGTHEELMQAAGISPADYGAVDYIVSHESSWNPNATEPNTGAHGLIQALPYGKTGCDWSDGVCQLQWGTQYAVSRYGSWWGAYSFWRNNHWW